MSIRTLKFKIRVVIEKDEDVGFFAYCPDLQGVAVEASNMDELKEHVQCAIMSHLESLAKHNDPIPVGLLESDETHDLIPFVTKWAAEKMGISKTSEYIQEILLPTDHNHATV